MNDEEIEDSESTTPDEETATSPGPRTGKKKMLAPREAHFAKLMAETGMGAVEAARIALGWRCEPNSKEYKKARNLAESERVKEEVARIKARREAEQQARHDIKQEFGEIHKGTLREVAFKILRRLADSEHTKSLTRFNAIRTMKKLHDPGKDVNLIWLWLDLAWRYQTAHCPRCHSSFPLAAIKNSKLDEWRKRNDRKDVELHLPDKISRQMELIKRMDKGKSPHPDQIVILSAPERHVVGLGGARAGKSYLLAIYAALGFLLPGVEVWILGETYERTSKEVFYFKRFLETLFYPHMNKLINISHDRKTGEMIVTSKWGSELRVKSAKSKGSITGHALEFALCAEPGWLPADIYEELRARMSERLGRIIALGTPKGIGGFVGRLTNMSGRDPKTNKVIRWKPEDRLIRNGAAWNISMLVFNMKPENNPSYVKSELAAARMELTDAEYASEFEGLGVSAEGAKFPLVKQTHLRQMESAFFARAKFVLGVDQGPKNFGVCLVAYDGDKIVPCWEFFNDDERITMKRNLIKLRTRVPRWIEYLGGNPDNWALTIVDQDPPLAQTFGEMEDEGMPWPTDITYRHRNAASLNENWRRENQEFINNTAKLDKLLFHLDDFHASDEDEFPGAQVLHDQVMQTMDVAEDAERESRSDTKKGWQVSDPFRGDHVLDAWYLAMWTIFSQQLLVIPTITKLDNGDPWQAQKEQFIRQLKDDEDRELRPWKPRGKEPSSPSEAFSNLIRPKWSGFAPGHYSDES